MKKKRRVYEVACGSEVMFDGALVRVEGIAGTHITICDVRANVISTVSMVRFISAVYPADPDENVEEQDMAFSLSSKKDHEAAAKLARQLRFVIYGTDYAASGDLSAVSGVEVRRKALAKKLGVTPRTVSRWIQLLRHGGEASLISATVTRKRRSRVDPRWDTQVNVIFGQILESSIFTKDYVLEMVEDVLASRFGAGVVPIPSKTTQYEKLKILDKGRNFFTGSTKARRSIADAPQKAFGRLRATRPGQYAILDTTRLDCFAMDPVTLRWARVDLTVVQDLYTRAIIGIRVTAESTKAIDVAGALFEACHPVRGPDSVPEEARWHYHGIPENLVFTEDSTLWGVPLCPPEAIVIDRGKAFLSAHVLGVCERMGITVMPAQPYKPTDKPTVERFFGTLRTALIQRLPAYTGPDVHSRGKNPEGEAFLYLQELEDVIREWIASVYHTTLHRGLCVPQWPSLDLSPNQMFELGVGSAGLLRLPVSVDTLYDFLDVKWRKIHRYGVEIGMRRYDGPALDSYRNTTSDYGGLNPGKWPFRVDSSDCRTIFFQDPVELTWHALVWEHGAAIDVPFSDEAYLYARSVAEGDALLDKKIAMKTLMARWSKGAVLARRERRLAIQMSAERSALPRAEVTPEALFKRHTGVVTAAEEPPIDAEIVDELDSADLLEEDGEIDESHQDLDLPKDAYHDDEDDDEDDYMEMSS